jgi:hypothetical protein
MSEIPLDETVLITQALARRHADAAKLVDPPPQSPATPPALPGYHLRNIEPGELGELSKIQEELNELADAEAQGSKIMMLVEAADLYGALQLYLERHFSGISMADLELFSSITRRAFENGRRASKR